MVFMLTSEQRLSAIHRLGRALSDPTRCRLLLALLEGPGYPADLAEHLGLTRQNVSNHLACLRDCGLVDSRPQGRASLYSLARPELLDLLAAAEQLLAATGEAVQLCPNYGTAAAVPALTSKESAR